MLGGSGDLGPFVLGMSKGSRDLGVVKYPPCEEGFPFSLFHGPPVACGNGGKIGPRDS